MEVFPFLNQLFDVANQQVSFKPKRKKIAFRETYLGVKLFSTLHSCLDLQPNYEIAPKIVEADQFFI